MRKGLRLLRSSSLPGTELYQGDDVYSFDTDWHFHEGWQVVTVTEGERKYELKSGSLIARLGNLVILPPRLVHRARCQAGAKTSFKIITFPKVPHAYGVNTVPAVVNESPLLEAFASICRNFAGPSEFQAAPALHAYLKDVLNTYHYEGETLNSIPSQISEIEDYLGSHLDELPSLSHLSALVGWNQFHMSHMFSKYVGLSPLAFHTRSRLMRARSLISAGWTLSDTSAYLRFADQSHFGRLFRRVYDMTPGEYQWNVFQRASS